MAGGPVEGAGEGPGAGEALDRQLEVMTALHGTLLSARAATVAEANGRAALFLQASSLSFVGLGLFGEATDLGPAFLLLALAVLPVLVLVGLATFARMVQASVEDAALAGAERRVRAFYLEALPALAPWMPTGPAGPADLALPAGRSPIQWLLTASGAVAAVNSALLGMGVALALARLAAAGLAPAAGAGLAAFALALLLHALRVRRAWARAPGPGIRGEGGGGA